MAQLISDRVRHRIAEAGYANVKAFAVDVPSIPYGSLRNAVAGIDPLRLARVYEIARALMRDGETVRDVVNDILDTGAKNDGVPDEPPRQPKSPPSPPTRRDSEKTKGPRRATAASAA